MLLGVHLTLLIGPTVPLPAPMLVTEALDEVKVTHKDKGCSGFELTLKMGRSGPADLLDYPLMNLPLLKLNNRVVIIVILSGTPKVLMDGIITNQQHTPSSEPGGSTMTITGDDISLEMDREEKQVEHPAQNEMIIANKILLSYAQYGILPLVIPPMSLDLPLPIERIPVQQATDLCYLKALAKLHGYVFYITPGPAPLTNTAYWGPPVRVGLPQKAITMNMGADTNVEGQINFRYNSLAAKKVEGQVQDRQTNEQMPVKTFASLRIPLALKPDWAINLNKLQTKKMDFSGLNYMQAMAKAQAAFDASTDDTLVGTGQLDTTKYGDLLEPRTLVGVRGAGFNYDGFFYVKNVTHNIKRGDYKQSFTISREGLGSTTPFV
ncbi:MAG: hypothetical protein V3W14_00635 [Candidatus Neomarinimicrobiota bacterium]